jgi:hypothetical protein
MAIFNVEDPAAETLGVEGCMYHMGPHGKLHKITQYVERGCHDEAFVLNAV